MTTPDLSRAAIEAFLRGESEINIDSTLLALRDALDAAERERDNWKAHAVSRGKRRADELQEDARLGAALNRIEKAEAERDAAFEEAKRLREALEKAKFTYDEWWKDDHYEAIVPLRAVSKIIDAALLPPEETP